MIIKPAVANFHTSSSDHHNRRFTVILQNKRVSMGNHHGYPFEDSIRLKSKGHVHSAIDVIMLISQESPETFSLPPNRAVELPPAAYQNPTLGEIVTYLCTGTFKVA